VRRHPSRRLVSLRILNVAQVVLGLPAIRKP
jgi:hypothetical protein